jgi:hypothetical protein
LPQGKRARDLRDEAVQRDDFQRIALLQSELAQHYT